MTPLPQHLVAAALGATPRHGVGLFLHGVGHGADEAFFMFWDTLWALVLGFTLSGAVQAFVSRSAMQRSLGDHRPRTLARSSVFGVVSSSCSYAASALAKTLFARGADFTAAMVFMIASTNLVVELGLVLWLLIGWQFAAAEFVGGAIMIALLGATLPRLVPARLTEPARARLDGASGGGAEPTADAAAAGAGPAPARYRTLAGWSDAAGYTISDLTMLRRELVVGFAVAGGIAAAVPDRVWRALFLTHHGLLGTVENVVLGPFLAIISFVCSVGNVPLAAALWKGGIGFGGVVSFVFADLLAVPLLVIYRKYYGAAITLRLLAVFWAVMSVGGLATQLLFTAVRIPTPRHPAQVVRTGWRLDYTAVLNVAALLGFAALYVLYRLRDRVGGGAGYAKDPVCGMQVEVAHAPAQSAHAGHPVYFCSDGCQQRFDRDPDRFLRPATADGGGAPQPDTAPGGAPGGSPETGAGAETDPVCGMAVAAASAAGTADYAGRRYLFCSAGCATTFRADPLAHLEVARDPVCGMDVAVADPAARADVDGVPYLFCAAGCATAFRADPAAFVQPDGAPAVRPPTLLSIGPRPPAQP